MDNFMGLPITPRFSEALRGAQDKTTKIKDLEASVAKQVNDLNTTGYDRLPGAAGKRDSDPQPSILEKIMKKSPGLMKNNPSMLEKYESYLRNIKKLPEEEVDKVMFPLWNNYLNAEDDPPKTT